MRSDKGLGKERLLKDRLQLLRTLRDCEAGKNNHLSKREQDILLESVKRRIAALEDGLKSARRG